MGLLFLGHGWNQGTVACGCWCNYWLCCAAQHQGLGAPEWCHKGKVNKPLIVLLIIRRGPDLCFLFSRISKNARSSSDYRENHPIICVTVFFWIWASLLSKLPSSKLCNTYRWDSDYFLVLPLFSVPISSHNWVPVLCPRLHKFHDNPERETQRERDLLCSCARRELGKTLKLYSLCSWKLQGLVKRIMDFWSFGLLVIGVGKTYAGRWGWIIRECRRRRRGHICSCCTSPTVDPGAQISCFFFKIHHCCQWNHGLEHVKPHITCGTCCSHWCSGLLLHVVEGVCMDGLHVCDPQTYVKCCGKCFKAAGTCFSCLANHKASAHIQAWQCDKSIGRECWNPRIDQRSGDWSPQWGGKGSSWNWGGAAACWRLGSEDWCGSRETRLCKPRYCTSL